MKDYNHSKIEKKWQSYWYKQKLFEAKDDSEKPKYYCLIEFPYPSGEGLHVGHIRSNTAMDIIARKRRAEGFDVLYPIGWDAFGLPTENYAIKTGIQPAKVTKTNTDIFRRQLKELGFSFDWSREINTSDPAYYKWTQWIFLQMFKKGLAYKKKMAINWCPKDKIGLANEEVIDGKCERCGEIVEKKEKEQWMLAITKYADRLDKDLDTVDFQERIKIQQRNWIGKSEGSLIKFSIFKDANIGEVEVFTTRADTLFGATYLVLAPEHKLLGELKNKITNWEKEVVPYMVLAKSKAEVERTADGKEKTGVELKGIKAINPANGDEIPVWIADYVLADYGTGAIMAVPAHDGRDFDFAKKFGLPIKNVIGQLVKVESGEFAHRPDKKTVTRDCILAIVKHWEKDEYLVLTSKKHNWKTFVIGGMESGEDALAAATREIVEETGYTDFKMVRTLGSEIFASHFAPHKDENRFAKLTGLYFELQSDKRREVSAEEFGHQEVSWVGKNKIEQTLNPKITDWVFWQRLNSDEMYSGEGLLMNSGKFDGQESGDARKAITDYVGGKMVSTYKLRDWVFSRQRYWGEPIPLVNCEKCGWVAVPEKDLPIELPKVKNYQPTDTGESPLASIPKWVKTKCPNCGGGARRETDTMPNWAGSSWYYLAYVMQGISNFEFPISKYKEALGHWIPVDWYNGGMEHTTLHLLYSRFWHKFLYDEKHVPISEPYKKRTSHGLILAAGGVKMSKSKPETIINPDTLVKNVGADALRLYEMFMGPFDQAVSWSPDGVVGTRRFLERVWNLKDKVDMTSQISDSQALLSVLHKTIKKIGEDVEGMRFNTAVSQLMIFTNAAEKEKSLSVQTFKILLILLAPFAPHITEELWQIIGEKKSIQNAPWPKYDARMTIGKELSIGVQINGKVRATIVIIPGEDEDSVRKKVMNLPEVKKWLGSSEIKKFVYVKERIVSIASDK